MLTASVYLGSSNGKGDKYMDFARESGRQLARRGIRVLYGGADVGTMKALAEGVMEAGGTLIGVFPEGFGGKREVKAQNIEILRKDMTQTILVRDFAERKKVLDSESDFAIVLPGSAGSMDELFCYAVSNIIGLHEKIVYILNLDGYYDGLKLQLETFVREGFLSPECLGGPSEGTVFRFCNCLEEIFEQL